MISCGCRSEQVRLARACIFGIVYDEFRIMKRLPAFLGWNAAIAAAFFAFWSLIVLLDVRVPLMHASRILKLSYFALSFAAPVVFVVVNCRILGGLGILAGLLLALLTWFVGVVVMVNLKLLLGGTV